MLVFDKTDDGFDGGAAFHLALDGGCHATLLADGEDLELVIVNAIVPLVSAISDDAGEVYPDQFFMSRRMALRVLPS